MVDSRSDEGSSGCRNVNSNNKYKGFILMNLSTYWFVALRWISQFLHSIALYLPVDLLQRRAYNSNYSEP